MKGKGLNVAVVGATGAVGTQMLRMLEERRFPIKSLSALASERSAGRRVSFNGRTVKVEQLTQHSFAGIDVALFSAGASRSTTFAPHAVNAGAVVVDNSSAFRMDPEVPLVVPEVNPHALKKHQGLIANPNCSTIVMVMALKPLHDAACIKRINVVTYQSVSGAGAKAMYQLFAETHAFAKQTARSAKRLISSAELVGYGRWQSRQRSTQVLPRQIAFNVIPQVDVFVENGFTKEEMKMVNETHKILEAPRIQMAATCVRVPVWVAHSEAVTVEFERELSPREAVELLRQAPGVAVMDDLAGQTQRYPTALDAAGQGKTFVGRIRQDLNDPRVLHLWVVGDNLLKGAALNAVQIAEVLFR